MWRAILIEDQSEKMNHFWFYEVIWFAQSFSGMHYAKGGAAASFSCVSLSALEEHTCVDRLVCSSKWCGFLNSFSGKLATSATLLPSPYKPLNSRCTTLSATQLFLMLSSQLAIFTFILHICFSSQTCQRVPFSTTYHNRSLRKWQKILRKNSHTNYNATL